MLPVNALFREIFSGPVGCGAPKRKRIFILYQGPAASIGGGIGGCEPKIVLPQYEQRPKDSSCRYSP